MKRKSPGTPEMGCYFWFLKKIVYFILIFKKAYAKIKIKSGEKNGQKAYQKSGISKNRTKDF